MVRRRTQTPEDYQRVRWVIWGCIIGLPSFLVAELAAETTLFDTSWGDFTPSEDIIGLLYLVNGVLCLFVFEAVRRPRVVSVAIPLRRVTILGLLLSAPALLMHHQVETIGKHLALPGWAWLALGAFAVFLISRLHESAVGIVDRFLNRPLDQLERTLSQAMRKAQGPADIDRLLADEPCRALKLSSAAAFRREGSYLVRKEDGKGWEGCATKLDLEQAMLAPLSTGQPFGLEERNDDAVKFPAGLKRPILAVPRPIRSAALPYHSTDLMPWARTSIQMNVRCFFASPTSPPPCTRSLKPSSCAIRSHYSSAS
jgi:hypothetical protein